MQTLETPESRQCNQLAVSSHTEPHQSRPASYGTDGELWLSCHKDISTEHTLATSVRTWAQLFQGAPVWLCHICPLYLINEMIFEKKGEKSYW